MRIENYFQQISDTVEDCPAVYCQDLTFDKRGSHEGFIRGELIFSDGSLLHFREFVDVEAGPDRIMYAYQYTTSKNILIFRYDNTNHHRRLNLPTYPHHKHDGEEKNVIASSKPLLKDVLEEIESLVDFG